MIQSDTAVYLWIAYLLLALPLDWLSAALLAALIHEACHILLLLLLGGNIRNIRISVTGCELESTAPGEWQALASILAGPAGSLILFLFWKTIPKLALCGLFQGLYNLLPLYPLDGGRVLKLLLDRFLPGKAAHIQWIVSSVLCGVILILSFCEASWLGLLLTLPVLRFFPRKIPCKPSQIKVQ